jgi:hypothetical protein
LIEVCQICLESEEKWCQQTPMGRFKFNNEGEYLILPTSIDECIIRKIFMPEERTLEKYVKI